MYWLLRPAVFTVAGAGVQGPAHSHGPNPWGRLGEEKVPPRGGPTAVNQSPFGWARVWRGKEAGAVQKAAEATAESELSLQTREANGRV